MAFLKNALMRRKKVKLINHDCLPISMLLYILPYLMLAYLTLFSALSNAVSLYNTFIFLPLHFANAFCFHALSGLLTHSLFNSIITLHHAQCF